MAWWIPLAMMAAGAAKSELSDRPAAQRQRNAEAEKTRWSPWTGMQGQNVQDPNTANAMMQGGMSGLMMSQNMDAAASNEQMSKLQQQYLENQNKLMEQQMSQGGGMNLQGGGAMPNVMQSPGAASPMSGAMQRQPNMVPMAGDPYQRTNPWMFM